MVFAPIIPAQYASTTALSLHAVKERIKNGGRDAFVEFFSGITPAGGFYISKQREEPSSGITLTTFSEEGLEAKLNSRGYSGNPGRLLRWLKKRHFVQDIDFGPRRFVITQLDKGYDSLGRTIFGLREYENVVVGDDF